MGLKTQVVALLHKNYFIAKRSLKLHFTFLLIIPALICLGAYVVETGLFSKENKDEIKSNIWVVLDRATDIKTDTANYYYTIINLALRNSSLDSNHHEFAKELEKNLMKVLADTFKPSNFASPEDFDDKILKDPKGPQLHGVFIIQKITFNGKDPEFDVIIQSDSSGNFESHMLGLLAQAMFQMYEKARSGSLERKRSQLTNQENLFSIFGNGLITAVTTSSLFPLILFSQLLISDKEQRVFLLMRLNGLTVFGYLISHLLWFSILYLIPLSILIITLSLVKGTGLLAGNGVITLLFISLNGINISSFSLLLSSIFRSASSAIPLITMLLSLIPFILPILSFIRVPEFTFFIPIFGYFRILQLLNSHGVGNFFHLITLSHVWKSFLGLQVNSALFLIFSFYFNIILDQNSSGVVKPWYFIFTDIFFPKASVSEKKPNSIIDPDLFDSDVKIEGEKVAIMNQTQINDIALFFGDVTKVYKNGKLAVDHVSFALESDQIFGLLGPNGAGKSTLIQIACGMISPSSGSVFVYGNSPQNNNQEYFKYVGYCPQHDVYWMNLSVTEHFEIFERLRGCEKRQTIKKNINKVVSDMRLEGYEDTVVSKLSGGERRRVSIGIALTNKKIVLLDEPTTGLDPKVRRMIWEIIEEFRSGRLVIITTHSMEEAELLSQKLTIMAQGRPRCFGTPEHLKQKFGGQIFLNISSEANHLEFAINSLRLLLPSNTSISLVHQSSDGRNAKLLFNGSKVELLNLMLPLLKSKKEFKIESFGVNQSSLDDVFMNIVKEADADV